MPSQLIRQLTVLGLATLLLPTAAAAQGGSISGIASDSSGGVLPGVLAEAASPVLIEGAVSAVTDGSGRYTIINLRPGAYTVTFSLPGFSTVVREGLVLTGDATAQVNVSLQVGSVNETVTVSGAAPQVDVQQARRQAVVTRQMMDTLPGARSTEGRVLLVPGVANTSLSEGSYFPTVHGSVGGEALTYNDGQRATSLLGDGNYKLGWTMNDAATSELTFETGGAPAEAQVGGLLMNAIPKEGGNTFSGTWFTYYGTGDLQSDNRTPELLQQIQVTDRLAYDFDTNPAFGGPIIADRLWFFASSRHQIRKTFVSDVFFKTGDLGFGHDGEQAFAEALHDSALLRLTTQVTPRNKFRISFDRLATGNPFNSVGSNRHCCEVQPEASWNIHQPQGYHAQAKWTSAQTNRLLFEAGLSTQYNKWRHHNQSTVGPYDISNIELTTGRTTVAALTLGWQPEERRNVKGSVSYVTGSHSFKAGVDHQWGRIEFSTQYNGDVRNLYFFNDEPNSVVVLNTPVNMRANINADTGVFVQDAWTIRRLTLNLGARYDYFDAGIPAQSAEAGAWVPARAFDPIAGPNWHTGVMRLGAAFDLFGDGRTALKGNVSQYVGGESMTLTLLRNPMSFCCSPKTDTRSWTDLDGNRSVIDQQTGAIQYEEVGPPGNANFGFDAGATQLDPDLKRDGHWETSVSIQHEFLPGVSVTGGYYRRNYYDLQWTDNLAIDPDRDYTSYSVTAPSDPRLPNGGGEVITLYNLNPDKLGAVDNLFTVAPGNTRVYNGFEMVVDGRLGSGGFVSASFTTERTATNNCANIDNPNSLRFCDQVPPFRTMFKLSGSYPLWAGVTASGFLQGMPGQELGATYSVNSAIAGVPLTGGGSTSVQLIEPGTMYYPYGTKLDLRVMKRFEVGRTALTSVVDLFNVLNSSTSILLNENYGASWQRVRSIMQGRFLRLGLELTF